RSARTPAPLREPTPRPWLDDARDPGSFSHIPTAHHCTRRGNLFDRGNRRVQTTDVLRFLRSTRLQPAAQEGIREDRLIFRGPQLPVQAGQRFSPVNYPENRCIGSLGFLTRTLPAPGGPPVSSAATGGRPGRRA